MSISCEDVGVTIPGILLKFLERASLAFAGTRDRDRVPHFHWVAGWSVEPDRASVLRRFVSTLDEDDERLLRELLNAPEES